MKMICRETAKTRKSRKSGPGGFGSAGGAGIELKTKLFGCMSQRAAANIQDEMEALGPVRLTEVQEAQKQIIAVARRMSDEGSIVLAGRGGDDYV